MHSAVRSYDQELGRDVQLVDHLRGLIARVGVGGGVDVDITATNLKQQDLFPPRITHIRMTNAESDGSLWCPQAFLIRGWKKGSTRSRTSPSESRLLAMAGIWWHLELRTTQRRRVVCGGP